MGPVDETALSIPDVLAKKCDRIAFPQIINPRSQLNVVLDQDRLARCESNDEPLVRAARPVIGEDASDDTFAIDLNIAGTLFEGFLDRRSITGRLAEIIAADQQTGRYGREEKEDRDSHFSIISRFLC